MSELGEKTAVSDYLKEQIEATKKVLISLINGEITMRGVLDAANISSGNGSGTITSFGIGEAFVSNTQPFEDNDGGYVKYEDLSVEVLAEIYSTIEQE